MRGWRCATCGQVVFLDSSQCLRCGSLVGFRPRERAVVVLRGDETVCETAPTSGCTWVVEDADEGWTRCLACRQVVLVPPLDDPEAARRYRNAVDDYRHLVVQLLELGLPFERVQLRLPSSSYDQSVTMGHVDGVVTVDVDEADDRRRAEAKHDLNERYRTVLGHLRHEFGHALFPHIVGDGDLDRVRAAFGDEREDYQAALQRHYVQGPPDGWQRTHVSAYATMHPSEDWAETFSHVLHVTDVLESAESFGLALDPAGIAATALPPLGHVGEQLLGGHGQQDDVDVMRTGRPDGASAMRRRLERFVPLAFALNEVARAMGEGDLYPFVLTEVVASKLELVGDLIGLERQPVAG